MSTETRATPEQTDRAPNPRDCQELVARLLASKQFRRSERHCAFLSYVCNVALTEAGREIREAEVGCKVFDRPAGYDTGQDNIVRVNASEVRHCLKGYFQTEGATEQVEVEIPRGNYRPVFRRRFVGLEVAASAPTPVQPLSATTTPALAKWMLPLLCFVLGGGASWGASHWTFRAAAPKATPVTQFWSRLFQADKPTDILMADSCLSLFRDLTKEPVSLSQYLNREYLNRNLPNAMAKKELLEMLMARRYTSMADAQLLRRVTQLAGPADQQRLAVYFARDYPADGLLKSNAIIIGSKRANPWVEPFERLMNFRFEFAEDTNITSIRNARPRPGESASYDQSRLKPNLIESYSVVALLPNLGGTGNALLLAGANMDGTQAAGEFVTSDRLLLELKKRLGVRPEAPFPYFEALLYSRRLGGATQDIEIQAARTH
jgi:hypothetical protein